MIRPHIQPANPNDAGTLTELTLASKAHWGYRDAQIEAWFRDTWQATLDFEIGDALEKLQRLSLAVEEEGLWRVRAGITSV